MDERLARWTTRFASAETEQSFRRAIFPGNLKNNLAALALAIPIFAIYALHDAAMLEESENIIRYRLTACAVSAAILFSFRVPAIAQRQEALSCLIMMILSSTLFYIVWSQETLDHTYYVGLIQGGVFVCFLLRVGFLSSISVLMFFLLGFVSSVSGKEQTGEAFVQSVILLTMFLICAFGSYLLQRYRRTDFLKTATIAEQNDQLKLLLSDVKKDNQRKVAALNMLVHFVKTPLHQISGFSDIVMNSLTAENEQHDSEAGVEGARYIKDATANLAKSVNSLLTYHRLDEVESRHEEQTCIEHAALDVGELINADIKVTVEGSIGKIKTFEYALKTAIQCVADYYNAAPQGATSLRLALSRRDDMALLEIQDNGTPISTEQFLEESQPLTKIENYLSGQGSDMPMTLRTIARAAEVCGGEFRYHEQAEGNRFTLSFRDSASQSDGSVSAAA